MQRPLKLNDKVMTGGTPMTSQSFSALKEAGVRTVISVDAATPNLAAASLAGLNYVHLPIGYDGVSDQRTLQLAKLVLDREGVIYIHCHHGKHRGPTAAAVACVAAGMMNTQQAVQVLKSAGTGERYTGLYKSVSTTKPIAPQILDAFHPTFESHVEASSLAKRMVMIDQAFENVKGADAADFPSKKLLLMEHYREMLRPHKIGSKAQQRTSLEFKEHLKAALELSSRIEFNDSDSVLALQENCTQCHRQFRN